jgi:hypothetical protein
VPVVPDGHACCHTAELTKCRCAYGNVQYLRQRSRKQWMLLSTEAIHRGNTAQRQMSLGTDVKHPQHNTGMRPSLTAGHWHGGNLLKKFDQLLQISALIGPA